MNKDQGAEGYPGEPALNFRKSGRRWVWFVQTEVVDGGSLTSFGGPLYDLFRQSEALG
jgi:hypothetical protein